MTDSLKLTIDLSHLPVKARLQVPRQLATVEDHEGVLQAPYDKPYVLFSPLSGTKTKWLVRTEPVRNPVGKLIAIPRSIDADLNLPNAITGQNLMHGTSVFAAGTGALWLAKIWLAQSGMERQYLDMIGTKHVILRSVTLTYLLQFPTQREAQETLHDLTVTGKLLDSRAEVHQSTNDTLMLPHGAGVFQAYLKTLLKYCNFADGAPQDALIGLNAQGLRLESKLSGTYLRKDGLDTLEDWRNAYEEGRYADLFDLTVRTPMRLNLRHKTPRPEALLKLTPTELEMWKWYSAGEDPRLFPSVLTSSFPASTYSKMHAAVLRKLEVEMNISWADHQRLRCFKLDKVLVYPGDCVPPADVADWCFHRGAWPTLLDGMVQRYEAALAEAQLERERLAARLAALQATKTPEADAAFRRAAAREMVE